MAKLSEDMRHAAHILRLIENWKLPTHYLELIQKDIARTIREREEASD